jgi:hypothetical protein
MPNGSVLELRARSASGAQGISPRYGWPGGGLLDEPQPGGGDEPAPSPPADLACVEDFTRYPAGRTHSPLTCAVTENLRSIAARNPTARERVFMKVGDSISATHEFLHCFETTNPNLAGQGYAHLDGARAWFAGQSIAGTTSFARESQATMLAQTAQWAMSGAPSPLERELSTMNPRYALVMFGTNDIGYGGHTASAAVKFPWMYEHITALVDAISDRGVVPVMYSIPPYDGIHPEHRHLVPAWNVVLRAFAEGRQLPFIDYHREMLQLPDWGLRSDGVHPSSDYGWLCDFSASTGLVWGYNLRNLLTLQALDRVWQVSAPAAPREAWDEVGAAPVAGSGAVFDPRVIDGLPFAELRDLRHSRHTSLTSYGGCGQTLSGAEIVYRVTLPAATPLRVMALHSPLVDARVAWLSGPSGSQCQRMADVMLRGTFPAGTHYFSIDAAGTAQEGEVLFLAAPCHPEDTRCAGAP